MWLKNKEGERKFSDGYILMMKKIDFGVESFILTR